MRVKIENKENCQKLIKIEVDTQKVNSILDEIYVSIGKNAQISGFRKGKAPRDMIESKYDESAKNEAINQLVWSAYRDTVKENNLRPVSYPIIENVQFNKNSPLNFTVKIDVEPTISLKSYTNIKIKKISEQVSEQDINKALEDIRERQGRYEPVEGRPVQKGDYVVCNYDCFVDGESIDQEKNIWLHINEDQNLAEIKKVLVGSNKSETKETEIILPQDYKNTKYSGKKGTYKITVNEIKKKILPNLDDELAKQLGDFKDLNQLKDRIRQKLELTKKQQQRSNLEKQIFDSLLNGNQFDVPESSVERQLQIILNDAKTRLLYQGYKKEEIDSQDEKLKQSLRNNAGDQVRVFFILDAISQKEDIKVEENEINAQIENMAKASDKEVDKFKKDIENRNLTESLRQQIMHDKVVGFLIEKARIV